MSVDWQRVRKIFRQGWRWRLSPAEILLKDVSDEDLDTVLAVRPFTMTTPERVLGLMNAVRYVIANNIPGSIVECGVWKGGSMMSVAKTLMKLNAQRDLYLFDTFAGMTAPSSKDSTAFEKESPTVAFEERKSSEGIVHWSYSPLETTRQNMLSTGYPQERIHFVKGPVEQTIPGQAPESIALLRLDTDFYESSKHELEHLYPRLVSGGVIIIDDYGHWDGARMAVDEYIQKNRIPLLLNRIDYTGRIGVKV
jgi:O-methyltransferase